MRQHTAKWQYWTAQVEGWRASGLGQRVYCERTGLKLATFAYWRQRLRTEDASKSSTQGLAEPGLTLVPLHLHGERGGASEAVLTLRSPAGWECRLPAQVEAQWLTTILRGLP